MIWFREVIYAAYFFPHEVALSTIITTHIFMIWNMLAFKRKLGHMPNPLDWRYLHLAFANHIPLAAFLLSVHMHENQCSDFVFVVQNVAPFFFSSGWLFWLDERKIEISRFGHPALNNSLHSLLNRTHCWFIGITNDFPFDLLNPYANASA